MSRKSLIKENVNTLGILLSNCNKTLTKKTCNKTNQTSILGDVVDYAKALLCQRQCKIQHRPMWLIGVQNP